MMLAKELRKLTPKWLLLACVCSVILSQTSAADMKTKAEQMDYLKQFAYLDSEMSKKLASYTNEEDKVKLAVKSFQRMAGINVTDEIDTETIDMMKMPRCGVKDQMSMGNIARRRRKRYAVEGSVWSQSTITYQFTEKMTKDLTLDKIKSEIKRAFQLWSEAVPGLKITEKSQGEVDILVEFGKREHGDGEPFDGPGKTLAHAFFPQYGGDIHFDDDETWTADSYTGTNLLQVAVHELGHSLGLGHSAVKDAIMAPFYRGYVPNVKLHTDDIAGMQYLYKDKVRASEEDWCKNSQFDAIVAIGNDLVVFKGKKYAKLDVDGIVPGYPKNISEDWQGLPDNIDAALHWTSERATSEHAGFTPTHVYFFKDQSCYLFESIGNSKFALKDGFPKTISTVFPGLPGGIDAAFVWSGNGRPYFVKGDKYYRYSRSTELDEGYPRSMAIWKGLPKKIDAAFNWQRVGRTYFFSENKFYRFNDMNFKTDAGYPKSTGPYWLGCPRDDMEAVGSEKGLGSLMMLEMNEGPRQFHTTLASVLSPTFTSCFITITIAFWMIK